VSLYYNQCVLSVAKARRSAEKVEGVVGEELGRILDSLEALNDRFHKDWCNTWMSNEHDGIDKYNQKKALEATRQVQDATKAIVNAFEYKMMTQWKEWDTFFQQGDLEKNRPSPSLLLSDPACPINARIIPDEHSYHRVIYPRDNNRPPILHFVPLKKTYDDAIRTDNFWVDIAATVDKPISVTSLEVPRATIHPGEKDDEAIDSNSHVELIDDENAVGPESIDEAMPEEMDEERQRETTTDEARMGEMDGGEERETTIDESSIEQLCILCKEKTSEYKALPEDDKERQFFLDHLLLVGHEEMRKVKILQTNYFNNIFFCMRHYFIDWSNEENEPEQSSSSHLGRPPPYPSLSGVPENAGLGKLVRRCFVCNDFANQGIPYVYSPFDEKKAREFFDRVELNFLQRAQVEEYFIGKSKRLKICKVHLKPSARKIKRDRDYESELAQFGLPLNLDELVKMQICQIYLLMAEYGITKEQYEEIKKIRCNAKQRLASRLYHDRRKEQAMLEKEEMNEDEEEGVEENQGETESVHIEEESTSGWGGVKRRKPCDNLDLIDNHSG
ncbi:hypothetical protein PENTCL1PPCAC_19876, partial [Pristionchus entomophagus]